jgi:hypothetical protein
MLCPLDFSLPGVGQQGDDGVDLAALEGLREALDLLPQPPVVERPQCRLPAWLR